MRNPMSKLERTTQVSNEAPRACLFLPPSFEDIFVKSHTILSRPVNSTKGPGEIILQFVLSAILIVEPKSGLDNGQNHKC